MIVMIFNIFLESFSDEKGLNVDGSRDKTDDCNNEEYNNTVED